jgi:hypothetical protein
VIARDNGAEWGDVAELMWVALGLTAILQLCVIIVIGSQCRKIERTQNEHARHLFALNQVDKAQARLIEGVRQRIYSDSHSHDHSPLHYERHSSGGRRGHRGERSSGDGQVQ